MNGDANEIAAILQSQIDKSVASLKNKMYKRGVVSTVSGQYADVFIEGNLVAHPKILCIDSYAPAVGDKVLLLSIGDSGSNLVVLGRIDGSGGSRGQLATTPHNNTNYHELLKTGSIPPSSWLMVVVDVYNSFASTTAMEYARYKINLTTTSGGEPNTLSSAKVYGDTLTSGVLTAVSNSGGSISLWGRSSSLAYRTTGLTYAYAMSNTGVTPIISHPMTSQTSAPSGVHSVIIS